MNTSYLLEPCCIERQAPYALSEAKFRAMMWTNGDVTVSHWFKALSYMAGPTHRLTLVVKEADVQMMRWIKTWMQRGWTTELRLTASTDARQMVTAELEGLTDRVTVAQDATIRSEAMVLDGDEGTIVIAGPMLTAVQPGLTMYAVMRTKDGGCDLLQAIVARHRAHALSMDDVRGQKEEVPEAPKKKSKKK